MKVQITTDPKVSKIENLFILVAEGSTKKKLNVPGPLQSKIDAAIKQSKFTGRTDEGMTLLAGGPRKVTLIGLGKESGITHRLVRSAIYGVAKVARKNRDTSIAVVFPYRLPDLDDAETTRWFADQLSQSDYKYDPYITVRQTDKKTAIDCLYVAPASVDQKTAKRLTRQAAAISEGVRTVRELGNGPGNEVTPIRLAERAAEVARESGIRYEVWEKKKIEAMKMGGLLAVNKGSAIEPRLIVLEYSPKGARKTVALVGKGITFDSGGISIKPAEKMEEMKFDMCGAAAVIGTMQAAAALELPIRIIGVIPSTENLPSGSAYKPGDIIRMMSGKTVEIVNTDAEGRMILGDALHYASSFKPDHLIDFATLTGACVVALGHEATGLFSNDSELAQKLIDSGDRTGEKLWRLPEWDDYKDYIKSEWADMKNSGGRWGGAISAAVFLKEFVDCPSWAHLDIAGTAWAEHETPREPKGATGVGVRVTIEFLEGLAREEAV